MKPGAAGRVERIGRVVVALDYAMSNVAAVQVDGGFVLIDTGPGIAAAEQIRDALAPHLSGELRAIIYTHSHADHVLGTSVWWKPGLPIWANERFHEEMRLQRRLGPIILERGAKQFGLRLPPDAAGVTGIGPRLTIDPGPLAPLIPPTHTFIDSHSLEIGGVNFELRHAPGETHDHLFVWLPQERTLLAGDNIYKAFPNLFTIRGSSPRPVEGWMQSLDRMRSLTPAVENLVLGHTEPVRGAAAVNELLTAYRDAIAFVHDSVIQHANKGLTPDEMVRLVKLPEHLAKHPYLVERYGTLAGAVRGIYSGYLGWFDGNASNLDPHLPIDVSSRLIPRLGGPAAIHKLMKDALAAHDPRWAAWLGDLLLAADSRDDSARRLKAQALADLARTTTNPLFKHWYLHDAALLRSEMEPATRVPMDVRSVEHIPIEHLLGQLPYRIHAQRAARTTMTIRYVFPDTGKTFTFFLRRGVGELVPHAAGTPDLIMRMDEMDFKRAFVAQSISPLSAEFWRKIKFEAPGGGLMSRFRALRRMIAIDRCIIRN
jgi:alkyl sulfatase BDS1-like metallo-beta-lactamase superfamily hydrolase